MSQQMTRRRFLTVVPPALGALLLAACSGGDDAPETATGAGDAPTTEAPVSEATPGGGGSVAQLEPTPACGDDDEPTVAQTEGPFFTPDSPKRTSLVEAGVTGTPLLVSGLVVNTRCEPIANALVDFWQADDAGDYDNAGFKLRGHQFTDGAGGYRLETILPGEYPGRTRHIHVKVQVPNRPTLTTQLYFPDEARNATDGIFDEALVMAVSDSGSGKSATFRFVLDV